VTLGEGYGDDLLPQDETQKDKRKRHRKGDKKTKEINDEDEESMMKDDLNDRDGKEESDGNDEVRREEERLKGKTQKEIQREVEEKSQEDHLKSVHWIFGHMCNNLEKNWRSNPLVSTSILNWIAAISTQLTPLQFLCFLPRVFVPLIVIISHDPTPKMIEKQQKMKAMAMKNKKFQQQQQKKPSSAFLDSPAGRVVLLAKEVFDLLKMRFSSPELKQTFFKIYDSAGRQIAESQIE